MKQTEDERFGYLNPPDPSQSHVTLKMTLPDEYGEDGVVLLSRDPYWAFTYWEISQNKEASLKTEFGDRFYEAQVQLRVYELTQESKEIVNTISIPVKLRVGSWYLHLGAPGALFQAEIGYLLTDGTFVPVAKSNLVELPPEDIASDVDGDWMIVEEDFKTLFRSMKKELGGGGSLESYIMREDWLKELKRRLEGEAASGFVGSSGFNR